MCSEQKCCRNVTRTFPVVSSSCAGHSNVMYDTVTTCAASFYALNCTSAAEEHSSTFIAIYSFPFIPCILYLIYFTSFFFLCRVSCRFVAYSSCCAFRLERDSPAFSSFTLRHRNGCTTGACAGDLFYQCIDCCRQPQNASVWLQ